MRKNTLLFTLALLLAISGMSQNLVSTLPELKNALIEEYTGMYCSNCPPAHREIRRIMKADPGRVFAIGIHQGYFAEPGAGDSDYRTPFGDSLAIQAGVTVEPSIAAFLQEASLQ